MHEGERLEHDVRRDGEDLQRPLRSDADAVVREGGLPTRLDFSLQGWRRQLPSLQAGGGVTSTRFFLCAEVHTRIDPRVDGASELRPREGFVFVLQFLFLSLRLLPNSRGGS